jgi:hypothetical protein
MVPKREAALRKRKMQKTCQRRVNLRDNAGHSTSTAHESNKTTPARLQCWLKYLLERNTAVN